LEILRPRSVLSAKIPGAQGNSTTGATKRIPKFKSQEAAW